LDWREEWGKKQYNRVVYELEDKEEAKDLNRENEALRVEGQLKNRK
jgi:hypothetical protein